MEYKLGCIPSKPDSRDFISKAAIPTDITLPVRTNNKRFVKYVRDQGIFPTCVGFGSAAYRNIQEEIDYNLPENGLSPLYIYTLCKQIDGIPNTEGTYPRCACEIMKEGVLPENDLLYSNLKNTFQLPVITQEMKNKAISHKIDSYALIKDNDLLSLKQAIYTQGGAIVGLMVTDSFINPENGKYIGPPNGTIYGGHLVTIIDYDDEMEYTFRNGKHYKGFLLVQNSWGKKYGDQGFAWMPYSLLKWKSDINLPFIYEMWSCIDYDNPIQPPEIKEFWRVQLYAFKNRDNAHKASIDLKSKGFDTYIFQKDGYHKIQCGAFTIEQNAVRLAEKLKNLGYNPWKIRY